MEEAHLLTRDLGGKMVEIEGESVPGEIVKFVTEGGATHLVMGQSARSRFEEIIRGSIINRIMRETRNVDIVVAANVENEIM